jgi:hypothetical protein
MTCLMMIDSLIFDTTVVNIYIYIYTVIELDGFAVVCCPKKNIVQKILLLLCVYLVQCYIFFAG